MQLANAGDLLLCVRDHAGISRLLGLEHRVHALGRNNGFVLVGEDERRILPIEYHHIYLLAEVPKAIYHMRLGRLVALGQIGIQHANPYIFTRITFRARVSEGLAHGGEPLLNIFVQRRQQLRKRPLGHSTPHVDSKRWLRRTSNFPLGKDAWALRRNRNGLWLDRTQD